MHRLRDTTQARIDRSFTGWPRAPEIRRFVTEVMLQRTRAVQSLDDRDTDASEEAALANVLRILGESVNGQAGHARAVSALAADVVTLSAFFQHLDLLPPEPDAHVDAIATMVGAAVHRLGTDQQPD